MTSSESVDLESNAVRERTDLYRQLREQLMAEAERYREQGKDNLADIISDSLAE